MPSYKLFYMISNIRGILLLAFISMLSIGMKAADRDSTEMLSIAHSFFNGTAARSKSNTSASSKNVVRKRLSTDMFNVYDNSGKQFVVVAKDDKYKAVIGYSDNSAFPDTLPDGLKWWLRKAESSMKTNSTNGIVKMTSSEILSSMTSANAVAATVSPFITTKWGQDSPYNLLTPKINGEHTYTGCIATAMAQCLKYEQYPTASKGTGTYTVATVSSGRNGRKDTTTTSYNYNFGQYTYNWSAMTDTYGSSYTTEAATAVSQLMMDCGAASKMEYMSDGSGATIYDATRGFFDYLQCDSNSIRFYDRDCYSDSLWTSMIYEELNAGYPVLYTGQDTDDGGHAFIFDGYDADGRVHVNWGWKGLADGYYDISLLNPERTGYDLSFSTYQMMITGIRTTTNKRSYQSQWLVYDDMKITKGNTSLSLRIGGFCNYGVRDFIGNIGLVAKKGSTYTALYTISTSNENVATFYGLYDYSPMQRISVSGLANGTYTLMLASKGQEESSWQPALIYGDVIGTYTLVKTGSNNYTITAGSLTTGIDETEIADTVADDGTTRVYNTTGQLIYSAPTSSFSQSDIPSYDGVVIIKQGSTVKKVSLNN